MIALKLTDIKTFMNQFLGSEIFDRFLLSEATIAKDTTITIDGHINHNYYTKDELEEKNLTDCKILPFCELRALCYQFIRGTHTPVYFKFVFMLSPVNLANTLSCSDSGLSSTDVNAALFHLTFQNGQLTLTTGVSYTTFIPDHTFEHEWDSMMKRFLTKHAVEFEVL